MPFRLPGGQRWGPSLLCLIEALPCRGRLYGSLASSIIAHEWASSGVIIRRMQLNAARQGRL